MGHGGKLLRVNSLGLFMVTFCFFGTFSWHFMGFVGMQEAFISRFLCLWGYMCMFKCNCRCRCLCMCRCGCKIIISFPFVSRIQRGDTSVNMGCLMLQWSHSPLCGYRGLSRWAGACDVTQAPTGCVNQSDIAGLCVESCKLRCGEDLYKNSNPHLFVRFS